MATLKQTEAVARIFRNKGKPYDFDEIWGWGGWSKFSPRASEIIRANYKTYDQMKEEMKNAGN